MTNTCVLSYCHSRELVDCIYTSLLNIKVDISFVNDMNRLIDECYSIAYMYVCLHMLVMIV